MDPGGCQVASAHHAVAAQQVDGQAALISHATICRQLVHNCLHFLAFRQQDHHRRFEYFDCFEYFILWLDVL